MTQNRLTYSKLLALDSFEERFEYLRLHGVVAYQTFGGSRWVNQAFYASREWKQFRDSIILRDGGCDLAHEDYPIRGRIILHHLNPITKEDLDRGNDCLFDSENVICTTHLTHNAIHYGEAELPYGQVIERSPNDTCPWKGGRL